MTDVSVIIPTHNPNRGRLQRTLQGLADQTLPRNRWELLIIDNGTTCKNSFEPGLGGKLEPLSVVSEPRLGLTFARLAGIAAAKTPLVILVDDDNVLAPNFLAEAVALFERHPHLGAAGGPISASFESPPPHWAHEFFPLLALRDLGASEIFTPLPEGAQISGYPECAPVGAGMVLRRECGIKYQQSLTNRPGRLALDRKGQSLTSGGDNDLVLTVLEAGWQVGYSPKLKLTHLIPKQRLTVEYLARLQHDLARSWIVVLAEHGICPWPRVPRYSVFLRKLRAWFRHQAWRGRANYIRWRGACGTFEGRSQIATS